MTSTERIQLVGATAREVVDILREAGIGIRIASLPQLAKLIDLIGDDGDLIEVDQGSTRAASRSFGVVVPNTYYNVNVKRSALVLGAAVLDAMATGGLASAFVALMGLSKQAITKVDPRSGEYCCLIHCTKLDATGAAPDPQMLVDLLSGNGCPFVPLQCTLMVGKRCGADIRAMEVLFRSLENKGALRHSDEGWNVEF
ncbi:MAG: hypothetical protein JO001_02715 [Alphaproteobacteria bacterium]|nr:hypothetical protein [Alphaproteobacteria bacterium]